MPIGLNAERNAKMQYCAFGGARHHSSQLLSDLQAFEPEAMVLHFGELKTLV
ncbi:hypothetical protein WGT02_33970 (plasmid) [Rhizobium sp. T1470]|uniref:hypothetical protein n=1 Tax=unclassified Rhizobium TaxID=2613769 RepID=UPI001AAEBB39|nr:hypothetical protein [Rhizobium sp. T1473]MCA0806221.1 hypothetical protein [Rhizobium sp. T1473]